MAKVDWSRRFVTDHAGMDGQHRILFDLLDKARAGLDPQTRPPDYQRLVLDLLKYVVEHFGYEYELMHRNAYPGLEAHHADHQRLTVQTVIFKDRVLKGEDARAPFVAFLDGWVELHIEGFDKGLANFLRKRGLAL